MERTMTLAEFFAHFAAAHANCVQSGNAEWRDKHEERMTALARNFLPSGSGFDSGTQFDHELSNGNRLVFNTSYHHMNDGGLYDGWSEHRIIVTPSFIGRFDIRVTGRNRNDIKDYIAETFITALSGQITETVDSFKSGEFTVTIAA